MMKNEKRILVLLILCLLIVNIFGLMIQMTQEETGIKAIQEKKEDLQIKSFATIENKRFWGYAS